MAISNEGPGPVDDREVVEGRLRFSPVLGHLQRDGAWVARLANTVETGDGRLVTIELRGDRAEVAERVLAAGRWVRASGRWSGRRFDIDRFDVEDEAPERDRRYRLADRPEAAETAVNTDRAGPDPAGSEGASTSTRRGQARPSETRDRRTRPLAPSAVERESLLGGAGSGEPEPLAGLHGRRPDRDGAIRI